MDTPPPTDTRTDEELADARATRLLIWIGAGAVAMLFVWFVIVLVAFI